MSKKKLVNVTFIIDEYFEPFEIEGYHFFSNKTKDVDDTYYYSSKQAQKDNRKHKQNAYVQYNGTEESSIIFSGGRFGDKNVNKERNFLEDVLVLGSILTAQNWQLFSRRDYQQYYVTPTNHLQCIGKESKICEDYLKIAVTKLKDLAWTTQFENGFHLRMLLNHANILNAESRFLSNVVIWEWLYPHLKNPNGAILKDECKGLVNIFAFVLKTYWPTAFNSCLEKNNIFYVLRNQLVLS